MGWDTHQLAYVYCQVPFSSKTSALSLARLITCCG